MGKVAFMSISKASQVGFLQLVLCFFGGRGRVLRGRQGWCVFRVPLDKACVEGWPAWSPGKNTGDSIIDRGVPGAMVVGGEAQTQGRVGSVTLLDL